MAVPASPFCASSDVAPYLPMRLNNRGDFNDTNTSIPLTTVNVYINNISTMILGRFRMAGYVTPLTALSGVTWPADQTSFLLVLAVMGTAGVISGPLVSNPGRRSSDQNLFQTAFEDGLNEIYDRTSKIAGPFYGCQYRSMTPAERAVGVPAIPTTSHLLEYNDPSAYTGLEYWTAKAQEYQDYMESLKPIYNYDYGLNSLEKGPYV